MVALAWCVGWHCWGAELLQLLCLCLGLRLGLGLGVCVSVWLCRSFLLGSGCDSGLLVLLQAHVSRCEFSSGEGAAALVGPLEKKLGTKSGAVPAGQSWVVLQIP